MGSNRARPSAYATAIVAALACVVAAPAAEAAPAGGWTATGSLTEPRHGHTATLLGDGSVLVAGGYVGDWLSSAPSPTAERYDPRSGTWATAGAMSVVRTGHTATPLGDGSVLVVGGGEATAERYDPETDSWSPAGTLDAALVGHTATLLTDGRVLVVGGNAPYQYQSPRAEAQIFDPATGAWTPAASLATARRQATASLLPDGTVLVTGGSDGYSYLASAERYDPAADAWLPAGDMSAPRGGATAERLADGSVLVMGGGNDDGVHSAAERFDPRSGSWSTVAGSNHARTVPQTVRLPNGTFLVAGGNHETAPSETYDPRTGDWLPTGLALTPRYDTTATLLADGTVLMAGGSHGGGYALATSSLLSFGTEARATPAAFGDATVGRSDVAIVTVRNRGDAPLFATGTSVAGPAAGDFAVAFDECSSGGVAPKGSCLVGIRFTPAAAGDRTATLDLAGNVEGGSLAIPLGGRGVAAQGGSPATINRVPQLRCRRGTRITVCRGVPARATRGRVPVRLTRGGKVFAKGHLRRGNLRLKAKRRIAPRRYTLRIGNRRQAWSMAVEVQRSVVVRRR